MQMDDDLAVVVDELLTAREARKDAERREEVAKGLIRQALDRADDTEILDANGRACVRLTTHTRTAVKTAMLMALYPDVYEECSSETDVVTLRTL